MKAMRKSYAAWFRHDGYMIGQLDRAIAAAVSHAGCRKDAHVIDIGCGSQPYAHLITGCGGLYTPCDIGHGDHVEIRLGEPIPLPEKSFDLGMSVQVLEHVWDLDEYLHHFHRHLVPGGRLVLSTHGVWLYHPHPTDFRRWTRDGLVKELESRGLSIESVTPVLGPMAWTTQVRSMGYIYIFRRAGVIGRIVGSMIALLMNARMWLEDTLTPPAIRMENACVYVLVCRLPNNADHGV